MTIVSELSTAALRESLRRLEAIAEVAQGNTRALEGGVAEIREVLVERGVICPDCGLDVEYVDRWRHVDPSAACFLYAAREAVPL